MLQSKITRSFYLSLLRTRPFIAVITVCAATIIGSSAKSETPTFDLPINCTVGEDCWLVNMVDRDPGPGHADYRCGSLSYNSHRGTDIAVANRKVMQRGVNVLAAADGVVLRTRDGAPPTTAADLRDRSSLNGRECGNGILIDHGDGWTTQYCHLKAGSLMVSRGSTVSRGQPMAEVGLTGLTEFPHVHFTVRKGNTVIDPFTGDSQAAACNRHGSVKTLWTNTAESALKYPGPQAYHLGFANKNPDPVDVRAGKYSAKTFSTDEPALVFWAEVFSLNAGDVITVSLMGPNGDIVADNQITVTRPQARRFAAIGRKKRGAGWSSGTYTGTVEIMRDGIAVRRFTTATIGSE